MSERAVISIVDDDESVRAAVGSLVRSLGYEALTFASAEAFLASSCVDETTCLISDVQMPGMDGDELQRQLVIEGHDLPMIFITAFPEERIRQRVEAAGAFGFLSKPFNSQNLISCLDAAIASRGDRAT